MIKYYELKTDKLTLVKRTTKKRRKEEKVVKKKRNGNKISEEVERTNNMCKVEESIEYHKSKVDKLQVKFKDLDTEYKFFREEKSKKPIFLREWMKRRSKDIADDK